jgi:AraC-like DNA-binding protein
MSTSSLYRLFKTELGISPIEFIILEKIKLAKQYLTDKSMYIKTVSYESGFEDSNYFIRVFKHYEGMTPKQYQQLLHKK